MKLLHTPRSLSFRFDDENLIGATGLVPVMGLAEHAGLIDLVNQWVHVPTDKGANPGVKVASLIGGMLCGADSISDMDWIRHGGMTTLFGAVYAPSTLGSFLRMFTHGHVSQLQAALTRFLHRVTRLGGVRVVTGPCEYAMVDIDDTMIETYGKNKQAARLNVHKKVHGLNVIIATLSGRDQAPLIVGQRLRNGATNGQRGARSFVQSALRTTRTILGDDHCRVLLRADSGFTSTNVVHTALHEGAHVSITLRWFSPVVTAVSRIPDDAWTPITYPTAVQDPTTGTLITRAQIAETPYTMFSKKKVTKKDKDPTVTGRLIVRRNLDPTQHHMTTRGQDPFFDGWHYHAFFTTVPPEHMDTLTIDTIHRQHAIIEQVHADLKNSTLKHLPSNKFTANHAWLILATTTYTLLRIAGT